MLVTMKEILDHASRENYAVAAPNVATELDARAYVEAAEELCAPLILDYYYGDNPDVYLIADICRKLAIESNVPIAVNLDHGGKREQILEAIRAGFTSVMVDRSSLSLQENIEQVQEIVRIAHDVDVSVEAELGHVGQAKNYAKDRNASLTSASEAVEFIEHTGVDCLAVAIGTAHGAYRKGFVPKLDFERLMLIKQSTHGFPLVLHGSSGTDHEDLKKACTMGINKVNISNDLCCAAVAAIKKADLDGQGAYDIYMVLRESLKQKLAEMIRIYGSEGKAWIPKCLGIKKGCHSMAE